MSWILTGVVAVGASFLVPLAFRELRKIRGPVVAATATVLTAAVRLGGGQRPGTDGLPDPAEDRAGRCRTLRGDGLAEHRPVGSGIDDRRSTVSVEVSEANPKRV
jgi:hypothetical protein